MFSSFPVARPMAAVPVGLHRGDPVDGLAASFRLPSGGARPVLDLLGVGCEPTRA